MERFSALRAALHTADGQPLPPADELSQVIGLAAARLRDEALQGQQRHERGDQRLALLAFVGLVALVAAGAWGLRGWVDARLWPWLAAVAVALGAGALWVALRLRRPPANRLSAAITRLGRGFWPVGVVPLSDGRGLLWDPLVAAPDALHTLALPADLGQPSEAALGAADGVADAFNALLGFGAALDDVAPQPAPWPAAAPDEAMARLGEEVAWLADAPQQTVAPPAATLPLPANAGGWEALREAGERLYHFFHERPLLGDRVAHLGARAERLADGARELLVDHRWQVRARVDDDRAAHGAPAALPTAPDAPLALTPAASAGQVRASLDTLRRALDPLDAAMAGAEHGWAMTEQRERDATRQQFADRRRALQDEWQRLDEGESEGAALAGLLDQQQATLRQQATQLRDSFAALAGAPLADLQRQLAAQQGNADQARALLGEASAPLDLAATEQALLRLGDRAREAHAAWEWLAGEMPQRAGEVRDRLDQVLARLEQLSSGQNTQIWARQLVQGAIREVERSARVVLSFAAAQEDPINPLEDGADELAQHLAAVRDERQRLAGIGAALAQADTVAPSAPLAAFLEALQRGHDRLAELDEAAMALQAEAARLRDDLRLRHERRAATEATLADLEQEEAEALTGLRQPWAAERAALRQQRAALDRLRETTLARLSRPRAAPALAAFGVLADGANGWPDRVVNQMGLSVDLWGEGTAALDTGDLAGSRLGRLQATLDDCYRAIERHAVPVALPGEGAEAPYLCFVPFWIVETEQAPGAADPRRALHLFPPLRLDDTPSGDGAPIASLCYPELSRRLLAWWQGSAATATPDTLRLSPDRLTPQAQALDWDALTLPPTEVAAALAQHWVFARSPDPTLNRIVQNSRDAMFPAKDEG